MAKKNLSSFEKFISIIITDSENSTMYFGAFGLAGMLHIN